MTLPLPAENSRVIAACGYHRMLRVARTLADLEGAGSLRRLHVAEALSFRRIAPNRAAT